MVNDIATFGARCSMILGYCTISGVRCMLILLHLIQYFNMAISGARRSMILLHLVLDVI